MKIHKAEYIIKLVDECSDTGPTTIGQTCYQDRIIELKRGLSPDLTKSTLIHELIHAHMFEYGYNDYKHYSFENVADLFGAFAEDIVKMANTWVEESI